ncbi:MAG: phosphodiesterase [Clostridia bacterium]|nr:phosphodiesterase [Clostridia bacterium]
MTFLIASDIHGSAYYCRLLLDAFAREGADKLVLLGDILYHGPRNDLPTEYDPKAVIALLNAHKDDLLCVRGNCDCDVDQMVLQFPILADYAVFYVGSRMIYATHGHVHNSQNLPPMKAGDVLLHGHTHVPACEQLPTHIYINPGSVSIPKENSPHSYLLLSDEGFVWKSLDGEIYRKFQF